MSYLFSWLRGGDLTIYYGVSYGSLDTAPKISNQPSVRSCLSMTPRVNQWNSVNGNAPFHISNFNRRLIVFALCLLKCQIVSIISKWGGLINCKTHQFCFDPLESSTIRLVLMTSMQVSICDLLKSYPQTYAWIPKMDLWISSRKRMSVSHLKICIPDLFGS